jgi:hypothetical protein
MNTKELRIGNYINGFCGFEDSGDVWEKCKVVGLDDVGITDHEIWVESNGNNETFIDFKGIPLTEEWLLKMGFVKKEVTLKLYYSDFFINSEINFRLYWPENGRGASLHLHPDPTDWYPPITDDNIKYVHQLQNLYFALTGEELTVK